ncbi:bifunctional [glutamine synthetase] adenylyltransferase/[glutamine synthetase]-adenylyl-L-tyrosine phosphorylase [Sneathiella marina]|uniref:Bifunctional glutamine synthetase adenylyltransferase/adenylyl-removing enzyme n=1 Tax=Sneathiella marina TaxID=2950108 RepID=A0ABY4VYP8_9PROT|nr:bifunctional [glutamine synthetase] adenylyltransferase/[glutamine synthetase]-adenylyl-L-tyrosine phosphorylase [Sneathiella marina]USG59970.1 bifunctional [glutamine synthetase] adenylyltransferase/[glutamine synthetase]-adenylyl-L-tyrosine phosphorylase [Sneathiella marina]
MQDIKNLKKFPFADEVTDLPAVSDQQSLKIGMEEWDNLISASPEWANFANAFQDSTTNLKILQSVFGNSPYLSQCLQSNIPFFQHLMYEGSDAALSLIYSDLDAKVSPRSDKNEIMSVLRKAKQQIALLTALCDMGHVWPLMQITRVLSDFAGCAVEICCRHLLTMAAEKGEFTLPDIEDPTRESGLVILGMGKLGANELNYSSDIDLIVLFDAEKIDYTGRRSLQDCFVKIARDLVQMMQDRTAGGYVFRTDLRLRPDPGATPIALSFAGAHVYYESQGQNWERAAMIKVRPIAGDLVAGADFVEFLVPFVWRKSMDFAAIEDIQAIKTQIHAHKGFAEISLAGHNIKIGRGGIREIEFFCQTQQLIEGGRHPQLRTPKTLDTLDQLADFEKISETVRDDLRDAYVFLRTLEHRLQMINDEQTQTLPESQVEFDQLGVFMGYDDPETFRSTLLSTLTCVKGHYDNLFRFEETPERTAGRLVFTGSDDDPETLKSLSALGFTDVGQLSQTVRDWHHGRYRATRTVRAQQILTTLMPTLLEALGNTSNPDAAFVRFDTFLKKLPAGIQLFSLFKAYPSLLELVARIMGMAPELADNLAQNPTLLDGVLTTDFLSPLPPRPELEEDLSLILSTARDFQDILDLSRRWANDLKFRVGVQILDNMDHVSGTGATVAAGIPLSNIAEVLLNRLYPLVLADLAQKHGIVEGGEFAVLGMGKFGSRQLMPRSDLDLVFIFDTPEDDMMTNGEKPISAGLFYTRISQRFINALSALTSEGALYEVDMRLRPHGKSGPIALNLAAFQKYYEEDAWTWEHMALTRSRIVGGDASLRKRADAVLLKLNSMKRDPAKLKQDIQSMRERVHKEHSDGSLWSLKHAVGGLMDLEFLCQYFRLLHGHSQPEILIPNTVQCFLKLAELKLLPEEETAELVRAGRLYLNIMGLLQLCLGSRKMNDDAPLALRSALAKVCGSNEYETLKNKLSAAQSYVDDRITYYLSS